MTDRPVSAGAVVLWLTCCLIIEAAPAQGQQVTASSPTTTAPATTEPTETTSADEPKPFDLRTTDRLTGDWFGYRTQLEEAGIFLQPILATGLSSNAKGGQTTDDSLEFWGYHSLTLELDFEAMDVLPGASLFFAGVQSWGDGVADDVGTDFMPVFVVGSSGCKDIELNRWWYRQRLFDDRLEFRLGKIVNIVDLFDRNPYAANPISRFMNAAFVYTLNTPVSLGLGASVRVWATDWLYVQAMVNDAEYENPRNERGIRGYKTTFHDKALFRVFGEMGVLTYIDAPCGMLTGTYRLGTWYDPNEKDVYVHNYNNLTSHRTATDDVGFYLNFDQMLWKEEIDPRNKQGLGMFARYGWADPDMNEVQHFWSVGCVYEGLFPTRDADTMGLGFAQAIPSDPYRRFVDQDAHRETFYELYYAIQITPWCTLTPDVQFISNPGGHNEARDSIITTLRLRIVF